MILVDANVFMYAVGRPHRHKEPSLSFLDAVAHERIEACIDAEVLQEILHRYRALGRWVEGRVAFDLARQACPVVIPISGDMLDRARVLLDQHSRLTARDAVHAAAALAFGLEEICSYDSDFDDVRGLRRLEPGEVLRRASRSK